MCMNVLSVYYIPASYLWQKRVPGPVELELQTVGSCHVSAEFNLDPLEEQPVLLTTEPCL